MYVVGIAICLNPVGHPSGMPKKKKVKNSNPFWCSRPYVLITDSSGSESSGNERLSRIFCLFAWATVSLLSAISSMLYFSNNGRIASNRCNSAEQYGHQWPLKILNKTRLHCQILVLNDCPASSIASNGIKGSPMVNVDSPSGKVANEICNVLIFFSR